MKRQVEPLISVVPEPVSEDLALYRTVGPFRGFPPFNFYGETQEMQNKLFHGGMVRCHDARAKEMIFLIMTVCQGRCGSQDACLVAGSRDRRRATVSKL